MSERKQLNKKPNSAKKKTMLGYPGQRLPLNLFFLSLFAVSLITQVEAAENILPPSIKTAQTKQNGKIFGYDQVGDVDVPVCSGTRNLNFKSPPPTTEGIKWTIESEIGSGSKVYPGREWTVSATIDSFPAAGVGDNGPNPLRLRMTPLGPAMAGADPTGSIPKLHYIDQGKNPVGLIGVHGDWGYSFDENSEPSILHTHGSGVSAKLLITIRATAPGVITLPEFLVAGYDSTPIAGNFACDPMSVNFFWDVVEPENIVASGDTANTDASYNNFDVDAATNGPHLIKIDVLANDYDPNEPGGLGDLSEVRVQDWDTASSQGGLVSCGTPQQKNPPLDAPLAEASIGICVYQPPLGFSGVDKFYYVARGAAIGGDASTSQGTVTIMVVQNTPPQVADPGFGTASGEDKIFDLNPYINDPQGDDYVCIANGSASPAVGTATVLGNCSLDWDNTSPAFTGNVTVPFKVCDTHPTLDGADLGANVIRGAGYDSGDLSSTQSRRCNTAAATIAILSGLKLPPTGVSDEDVVDSGYAADGVGSYSLSIPVLANDTDGNGPNPSLPSASPAILTPPAVEEGVAGFSGDKLIFTPADGFSGEVTMTYRVCEDPAVQSPPYFDDPNTPLFNEGLPVCGVGLVTVQVLGNEPPVAALDETSIADVSLLSGFDLGSNDSDPDGDAISCTAGTPVASDPALVETASVSADCKLSFNPVDGQTGIVEFTYEVCDSHPLTIPAYPADPYGADGLTPGENSSRCSNGIARVTVNVAPEPEAHPLDDDPLPQCVADAAKTAVGVPITINVIANDSDLNDLQEPSAVILTGPPEDAPLATVMGGNAKMNGAETILYTPPQDFQGSDSFTYTARDEAGQGCVADVTISVGDTVAIPSQNRLGLILMILLLMVPGLHYSYRRK